jgi:hypothetical protein
MHDGWLGLYGMKDCFMGLRSGGDWLTTCSAIVSSSTLNSSSSSSTLSLGFCRMVRSITVSIGRMVGFLDRSPYMNQMKFYSTPTLVLLFGWSLELHSIIPRSAFDRSWPALNHNHRNYIAANWNKTKNKKQKI